MNSETDVNAARAAISKLESDLADLDARAVALSRERAQLTADLTRERAVVAAAHAEAKRLEREPADRKTLEGLGETLRARLRSAPHRSPTVQRVRTESARLIDETVPAADRLTLVRSLLDDMRHLVQLDGDIFASASPYVAGRE